MKMRTESNHISYIIIITLIFLQISEIFCFRKCCRKGAHLSENGRHCTLISEKKQIPSNNYKDDDVLNNNSDWFPRNMFRPRMKVYYGASPCPEKDILFLSINETNYTFLENETLVLTDMKMTEKKRFNNDSYCVDFITGSMGPHVIKICACNDVICIDKCCPKGQVVYLQNTIPKCVHNDSYHLRHRVLDIRDSPVFYRYHKSFFCENGKLLRIFPLKKGIVSDELQRVERLFSVEVKCVDYANGARTIATCSRPTILQGVEYLSRSLTVVVAISLMLTFFALWSLSELKGTTHGRALLCHVFSLVMVNTLRATSYFYDDRPEICINYAFSVYFFLTAANMWVNVLTLDMADGLRRPLHERALGDKGRWRRTIFFGVYAWGAATALTYVVVRAEFATGSSFLKPTYQETRSCRFTDSGNYMGRQATLYYYYAPMGIIFLLNLFVYGYLAIRLHRLHVDSEMVDEEAINEHVPAHRSAAIFFRILMMMGTIEWVVELSMWGLRGKYRPTEYLKAHNRYATLEDGEQAQTEFRIAGVVLDVLRAGSLAWVCCGRPRVRRRLSESVRRTLNRTLSRPLRLVGALSNSAAGASGSDADASVSADAIVSADPNAGGGSLQYLRKSVRRLRSWPLRLRPAPALARSLSDDTATTVLPEPWLAFALDSTSDSTSTSASPQEHIEMRTFSVSSEEQERTDTPDGNIHL